MAAEVPIVPSSSISNDILVEFPAYLRSKSGSEYAFKRTRLATHCICKVWWKEAGGGKCKLLFEQVVYEEDVDEIDEGIFKEFRSLGDHYICEHHYHSLNFKWVCKWVNEGGSWVNEQICMSLCVHHVSVFPFVWHSTLLHFQLVSS